MNPLYLIFKTNGDILLALRKEDALAVSGTSLRLEVHPTCHGATKIAAISGSNPTYTVTANNAAEFNNQHGRSF
jgi:hypothetical protein